MTAPGKLHEQDPDETADESRLLRRAARDLLASLYSTPPGEGWAHSWPTSWKMLQDHGLWSTIEPPDGSLRMALVVAEELGRALYPGPAYEVMAGAAALGRLDEHPLGGDVGSIPAVALVVSAADGYIEPFVDVSSETLLMVAHGNGIGAVRAADTHRATASSIDQTRNIVQARLTAMSRPVVNADAVLYARAARSLLYCADTLGCVQHVLAKTTEYAKQRTTFGVPIGKYQAVAHRLVDHIVTARQMEYLIATAAEAFDRRADDLERQMAITQTYFWGRGMAIISDCIQLCGGIGFTWEWGHHFYL